MALARQEWGKGQQALKRKHPEHEVILFDLNNKEHNLGFDPNARYVTAIKLAPPGLVDMYENVTGVTMSDFAHCHDVAGTKFNGSIAARVWSDANNHTRELCLVRTFCN